MEKKEISLNNKEIKDKNDEKLNNTSIIEKNGDNLYFDSKSEIENKDKNDSQSNISKSLSVINKNNNNISNSEDDKKNMSIIRTISESKNQHHYPTKRIIVEINQLSKRVTKEENENEYNNRIMVKELRSKYFPLRRGNNTFRNNYHNLNKEKNTIINNENYPNNFKFKNMNVNISKSTNPNIFTNARYDDKKPTKPNLLLNDINEFRNSTQKSKELYNSYNGNNNNNYTSKSNNHFGQNSLRVSDSNNFSEQSNTKPLTLNDLECFPNDNEKIKALLFKYNELLKNLNLFEQRYLTLKSKYNELNQNERNSGNISIKEEDSKYKKYINEENKNLNSKLENYEKIFPQMIYYINDLSNELSLKKINFVELKNYMNTNFNNSNQDNPITSSIDILNENKRTILNRNKKKDSSNKKKTLNRIKSFSNNKEYEELTKKIITGRQGNKVKTKKFYDKL
jgi:hypothetical protein